MSQPGPVHTYAAGENAVSQTTCPPVRTAAMVQSASLGLGKTGVGAAGVRNGGVCVKTNAWTAQINDLDTRQLQTPASSSVK